MAGPGPTSQKVVRVTQKGLGRTWIAGSPGFSLTNPRPVNPEPNLDDQS